jgi:aryl-alcohol dehydrogenase-like predicted oxidoreductase
MFVTGTRYQVQMPEFVAIVMQSLQLGITGPKVSAHCLGTMYFGTAPHAAALLTRFRDAGGTFLDTANVYAGWVQDGRAGDSEGRVGSWLAENQERDNVVLATKVGFGCKPSADTPGIPQGLRPEWIRAQCEASLKRLRTSHIDLYYAHLDDREVPIAEWLGALQQLRSEGKILHLGISNFAAWRLALVADRAGEALCAHQSKYTYLRPVRGRSYHPWPPANEEHDDAESAIGVTRVAYSPLLKGAYQRPDRAIPKPYKTPENQGRLTVLAKIAKAHGVTPGQVVLAWLQQRPAPVIPLYSASTVEQLDENLAAADLRLSDEDLAQLS